MGRPIVVQHSLSRPLAKLVLCDLLGCRVRRTS